MIKKKSSKQNFIIAILCILLIISIVFGFTYSYYNGRSNLVKGTITTANLSIELHDNTGKTTEFSISAPLGEEYLVPGNNLNNVALNIYNKCNRSTYMVVVYTLSAIKVDTLEDVTHLIQDTKAIEFQEDAFDTNIWQPITYQCKNSTRTFTCLVGKHEFDGRGDSDGVLIPVLYENKIKIPGKEWGPVLMNCNVTISVMAYAIQSDLDDANFYSQLEKAQERGDTQAVAQLIAEQVLVHCQVDVKEQ